MDVWVSSDSVITNTAAISIFCDFFSDLCQRAFGMGTAGVKSRAVSLRIASLGDFGQPASRERALQCKFNLHFAVISEVDQLFIG